MTFHLRVFILIVEQSTIWITAPVSKEKRNTFDLFFNVDVYNNNKLNKIKENFIIRLLNKVSFKQSSQF